jgi:uncharacterized membrane protein SpoIIM required for sporulation
MHGTDQATWSGERRSAEDAQRLARLADLLARLPGEQRRREPSNGAGLARTPRGTAGGADGSGGLDELPALYRFASTELARSEAAPADQAELGALRALVIRAHQVLFRGARERESGLVSRALRFLLIDSPRAVRAEWRLLASIALVFYGLALAAYLGVRRDLELAWVLQPAEQVEHEIEQLRALAPGQPFRGNFTFGARESGSTAGQILANNISVALLFFGAGLVPPLFLLVLVKNGLMLGTYLGIAAHWGQAGAIASIFLCHGTVELQMIVLAGGGGLVLARAWLRPGPWSRSHAMTLESRRAWALVAPAIPFLFFSGLIEGYVSPHAALPVRLATAALTGLALLAWAAGGERPAARPELPEPARA